MWVSLTSLSNTLLHLTTRLLADNLALSAYSISPALPTATLLTLSLLIISLSCLLISTGRYALWLVKLIERTGPLYSYVREQVLPVG